MKVSEKSVCHARFQAFETLSDNSALRETLEKKASEGNLAKDQLFIDIEVLLFLAIKPKIILNFSQKGRNFQHHKDR